MLFTHLFELKWRLIYFLLSYFLTILILYHLREELLWLLSYPLLHHFDLFIFTNLMEAFSSYMKIILYLSLLLNIPLLFFQIWLFIIPGLYNYERNQLSLYFVTIWVSSILMFYAGIYYILPQTYQFFIEFGGSFIQWQPKINEYIHLIIDFFILFLFISILPLILHICNIHYTWLVKGRKYVIVCILLIAGLISPPDVYMQILISIPIICIYEGMIYFKMK